MNRPNFEESRHVITDHARHARKLAENIAHGDENPGDRHSRLSVRRTTFALPPRFWRVLDPRSSQINQSSHKAHVISSGSPVTWLPKRHYAARWLQDRTAPIRASRRKIHKWFNGVPGRTGIFWRMGCPPSFIENIEFSLINML